MSERDSICAPEEKLPVEYRPIPEYPGYHCPGHLEQMSFELFQLVWFQKLLIRIELYFTGDDTWCDGCKRFSPGDICPYCPRNQP